MQLRFEQLLSAAKRDGYFIGSEKEIEHSEVEEGALIETDKNFIFVGASVPPFSSNDREVLCITKEAPVFKSLTNKKAGDQVIIGNNTYTIKKIS